MSVKFIDFSQQYEAIKPEINTNLEAVFRKSNFILGEEVKKFEDEFAGYCESAHGIGLNSGTDALFIAMKALGLGPGDEVIVPTFTFIATALGVTYTGATPVFVDVQHDTCNIDPKRIEAAITKKTKLIIAVHMYGQPADMDEVLAIAKKHKLKVLEDAAQAHGARYKKKRIGSLSDVACFSFYPTKGLGGFGDGGMVVTSDKKLHETIRMLRDYGRKDRYEHIMIGYNTRLDTLQAVVLSAKLKFLDEWNAQRAKHAETYRKNLNKVKGVELLQPHSDREHVYQTFAVKVPRQRDPLCERLQQKGIGCLIHYPIPIHLQHAYKNLKYKRGDFPVAEKICNEILSLPMFPHMKTGEIEEVCTAVKGALC